MSIQKKKLRKFRKIILIFYFTCKNFNYNIKHFKITLYYMTELQIDRSWEKNQLIKKLHVLLVDYSNMEIIKMK